MSVKSPATLTAEGSSAWKRSPQNTDYHKWIPVSNSRLTSCDLLTLPKVGEALLVAGNENQISLWDMSNGSLLWRYSASPLETTQKSSMQLRQSTVTACKAISGEAFCTSNAEGSIQRWNLAKEPEEYGGWYATCVAQESGHTAEVTSMSVYLNGTRIMTTSKDFTVRIWDTSNMSVVRTFEEHYCEVYGSAVTEDGTRAITSGQLEPESSSVIIWDPNTGKVLHTPTDHSGWLDVAAISGPAGLAAVTGVHGTLFVWDIESGVQQYTTKFSHGSRSCCRFSTCGMFILVGGYSLGELVLLESRYGQELVRVHTTQEPGTFNTLTGCFFLSERPSRVSFSSCSAGSGGCANGSPTKSGGGTYGARSNGGSSVKGSPSKSTGYPCGPPSDGDACGCGDYSAGNPHVGFSERYYNIDPGEKKAAELRRTGAMIANRCSPSSIGSVSRMVTSSGKLSMKGRHNGRLGRSSSRVVPEVLTRFSFPTRFGAVCTDGSIRMFNLEGDSFDDALWRDERMQDVYDVDVSRDATLLFTIYKAGRFQEELHLYDFATGELVWNHSTAHKGTYGLYLVASSDAGLVAGGGGSGENRPLRGKMITTGGDRKVRVFDLAKRQMIRLIDTAHTQDIVSPQINARFDQMLTTCDGWDAWTCLWDLNTGQMLRKYDQVHNEGIYDAWFTPDDLRCVSVSCDKTAAIFDLASGDVIQRFVGHEHWVRFAALSPDEKVLATASNDNTVRIWNVAKGNQLHVIRDHRGTLSWINFVHPTWIVTSARDGTIVGFNLKTGVSVPLLVAGPIGKADGAEKIRSMPLSASVAGPRFPPVLAISLNARAVVLHLSVRQPMPQQLLAEMKSKLWDLEHVKKLADTFPGLAVVPLPDGNTLLHTAALGGQVEFLRVLLTHGGSITSAPLPANGDGKTPLDLALDVRNLQCVELLLANEVARPPPLRLAAMKAWSRLAADMPAVLVKFLNAVGIEEPTDAVGSSAVMVPVREGTHLITCGSQKFTVDEKLWEEVLAQHGGLGSDDEHDTLSDVQEEDREGGEAAAGEEASAPLRAGNGGSSGDDGEGSGKRRQRRGVLQSAWRWARRVLRDESPSVLQPAVPGVCGLPYVALTTRSMADSPLGALVLNNVSDAFTTDIGFAMLTYKWDTYAGAIYRQQGLVYGIFMVMYILATTLGLQWNLHVDRESMYQAHRSRAVVRILLESGVLLLNARYLLEELRQIWRHGPLQYFTGHNSAWNWVELLSCIMVNLVVLLQVLEVEAARWVMSACTILLGTRLLKVASGSEGTGIFVQVIIRIISDLRHYLLIVGVTLLTFALAFRQIVVYFEQMSDGAGVSDDFTKNFDTFPDSMLSVYYFMTVGGFSTDVGGQTKYVWYLHVLLISFSFMVSIILLNLLIAVMSDTYVVVKQHAKSEWMLLKARLVLEIDSNMPDSFFDDRRRSAPRWLHVVNTKRTSSPAHASLLDTIRGTVVRQALNTDLTDTKHEIKTQIASLTEQIQTLQRDITRLSEALSGGGGPDRIDSRTTVQQVGAGTAANGSEHQGAAAAAAAAAPPPAAAGMPLMTRSLSRRPEACDELAMAEEDSALPGALPGAPAMGPSE